MAAATINDTRISAGFTFAQLQSGMDAATSGILAAIGRMSNQDPAVSTWNSGASLTWRSAGGTDEIEVEGQILDSSTVSLKEFDLATRDGYNIYIGGGSLSFNLDSMSFTGGNAKELFIGRDSSGFGMFYQGSLGFDTGTLSPTGTAKSMYFLQWTAGGTQGYYVKLTGNMALASNSSASKITGMEYGTFTQSGDDFPKFKAVGKSAGLGMTSNAAQSVLESQGFSGLLYAGNDNIRGTAGDDYLDALAGNDNLDGGNGNDTLAGGEGNDVLTGGAGNDVLVGWKGKDTLTTGAGNDIVKLYHFGTDNAPVVKDFKSGEDKLKFVSGLEASTQLTGAYTSLAAGFTADNLVAAAGAKAQEANDFLLFDTKTGKLYYDADGVGAGAAELVATLTGVKVLAATDIAAIPPVA